MMTMVLSLLGVAIFICMIGVLFSHVRLIKLSRENPNILARAGIGKIDWWWGCIRGVFLLGFTRLGQELSAETRMAFRAAILTYVLVFVAVVLITVLKQQ